MSPVTPEEAWAATDPTQTTEERQRAAENMIAGVAANDAYYASRSELEQLIARANGGQVVAHADLNSEEASGGDLSASDTKALPTESAPPIADATVVPDESPEPTPDTPADAESGSSGGAESDTDKLRAQLLKYGITPDA